MKIKTTIALTCLLLAGCEAKVKIETKTSEPFTTNEFVVGGVKIEPPEDSPDYWLSKMSIYRCDDGTFEVDACGNKHAGFKTIDEARIDRMAWAYLTAERCLSFPLPSKPCGVKIE